MNTRAGLGLHYAKALATSWYTWRRFTEAVTVEDPDEQLDYFIVKLERLEGEVAMLRAAWKWEAYTAKTSRQREAESKERRRARGPGSQPIRFATRAELMLTDGERGNE